MIGSEQEALTENGVRMAMALWTRNHRAGKRWQSRSLTANACHQNAEAGNGRRLSRTTKVSELSKHAKRLAEKDYQPQLSVIIILME